MSVSAIFGVRVALPSVATPRRAASPADLTSGGGAGALTIECSSRPQKKATKHHMKTRPKKTQPWDVRRKPAVYDPLPPLPPDVTLVASAAAEGGEGSGVEAAEPVLSGQ